LDPSNEEFIKKGLERIFAEKEAGPIELDIDFSVFDESPAETADEAQEQPEDIGDETIDGSLAAATEYTLVECSEMVATLDLGDWLETLNEDGSARRVRFTWISPDTGHYLFTTRTGEKALDTTMTQLATMLRDGKAKLIKSEPDPLFERALGALINKLEDAAESE